MKPGRASAKTQYSCQGRAWIENVGGMDRKCRWHLCGEVPGGSREAGGRRTGRWPAGE